VQQPALEVGRCRARGGMHALVVERCMALLVATHQFGEPAGLEGGRMTVLMRAQIGRGAQGVSFMRYPSPTW